MSFDQNERALLGRLADELIPAGDGLPRITISSPAALYMT